MCILFVYLFYFYFPDVIYPRDRKPPATTASKPFSHTTMNFWNGQNEYLLFFTCVSTKVVHIEVVEELSLLALIRSFKKFTGMRGNCTDLYMEDKHHNEAKRLLRWDEDIFKMLFSFGTTLHLSSAMPHVKNFIDSFINEALTSIYDILLFKRQMKTDMKSHFHIQLEYFLNSRPMFSLSRNPNDFSVRTPLDLLNATELYCNTVPDRYINQFKRQYFFSFLFGIFVSKHNASLQNQNVNVTKGELVTFGLGSHDKWLLGRVEVLKDDQFYVREQSGAIITVHVEEVARLPTQPDIN